MTNNQDTGAHANIRINKSNTEWIRSKSRLCLLSDKCLYCEKIIFEKEKKWMFIFYFLVYFSYTLWVVLNLHWSTSMRISVIAMCTFDIVFIGDI